MIVYFEICGKKFRSKVKAKDEETARYMVYGLVKFTKFEPDQDKNNLPPIFQDIFNQKKT